ncbi:hypothetical protein J5J83_21965 [Azoarcus sp. L1K30]|uniref:hypothetical protein n=1 Tax=Azoarcus sp. L1K30 TaxID=2820277 RepID=UPI001B83A9F1|nr:hypothetical protein [Azoarcus sp. L1K30]MBR0568800.1 hypothetical protein [Azoarcus sp. L1K30]
MAIGWLTLLKTVPWADVISTAPVVADGARKLWNTVARKSPAGKDAAAQEDTANPTSPEASSPLESRLSKTEDTVADLHAQMLASSELIKALADQNTELVKRVEANRVRLIWLSAAVVVSTAAAISCLLIVLRS